MLSHLQLLRQAVMHIQAAGSSCRAPLSLVYHAFDLAVVIQHFCCCKLGFCSIQDAHGCCSGVGAMLLGVRLIASLLKVAVESGC
jgi:hypothetical protein